MNTAIANKGMIIMDKWFCGYTVNMVKWRVSGGI